MTGSESDGGSRSGPEPGVTRDSGPARDPSTGAERVDLVVEGGLVVTMDAARRVLADATVAVRDGMVVAVGPSADLAGQFVATARLDARRRVVVPGLVNAHLHVSTEPITRGVVPDDTSFEENVFGWLSPLAAALGEEDERLSAQLGAAECLRSGTTCFLDAGTGWHLDAVVDGLGEAGIRAQVGRRTWDRPATPEKFRQTTSQAVANLTDALDRHGAGAATDGRVRATAILVGHTTCTDDLWRAARSLADEHRVGLSFHMSPAPGDARQFLAETGERPVVHLDRLGVLGDDVVLVHGVHLDDEEVRLLGERGCSVAHCPTTALKVAYGVSQVGRMPELVAAGANLCIGTDGANAANAADLYRAAYLVAGLWKDARRDPSVFPATEVFAMATRGGARALGLDHEIGSIEVGKRADLVLHDRDRPEWTPLHDVANQLVYSADGRSVHTVLVDGRIVVDAGRLVTVDEERLYAAAEVAARRVLGRLGRRPVGRWPERGAP